MHTMTEGSRQSFSSYAETDRSNFIVICTPINIKDEISFRLLRLENEVDPIQTFWKRIRSV